MPVQDARGRVFDTARTPQRIVSLVPSLTESLFAFGAGARVVGVTDYCIHPREGVATKARIGGTKNPRVADILALTPDLVIANVEENRKVDIDALEARGVPVCVTFPRTVRAALDELRALAQWVGAPNADAIIQPIEAALARQQARRAERQPRVFVALWRDPWMTATGDTYIGDLIETCGGDNIFRHCESARYPRVSLDEVAARKPEVILLPDEPYRFSERDADELRAIPALRAARLHLVDGTLVVWHGVRMARALETISKILELR